MSVTPLASPFDPHSPEALAISTLFWQTLVVCAVIGAVVAGCLLVFGSGLYPRDRAAWRVFALTLAFAAVSGAGDLITGGNYMYLRVKPQHNSLLGLMGPWPWYIVGGALLGLAMLLVAQWLADWVGRRDPRRLTGVTPDGSEAAATAEALATSQP